MPTRVGRVVSTGLLMLACAASSACAEVKLAALFSDHMVLQQAATAPVWGTAAAAEQITVTLGKQTKQATADANGRWGVELTGLAPGPAADLTASGASGPALVVHDVLVGEVWLASGQSNMDFTVAKTKEKYFAGTMNEQQEIAAADFPQIRMFTVPLTMTDDVQSDVGGHWAVCSPKTVGDFSAAAYFFARDLHLHLHMPVGVITSAYGASSAQAWISKPAIQAVPELASLLDDYSKDLKAFDSGKAQKQYGQKLADWEKAAAGTQPAATQAAAGAKPARPARKPAPPHDPRQNQHNPSLLYNAMIAPVVGYGIRGAIWYQGESNGPTADRYEDIMLTLVGDWRKQWAKGDFPFIQVQLAGYRAPTNDPNKRSEIATIREAQAQAAAAMPAGAIVTAADIGDETNIHPKNKQEVGRRLALAAEALAYHEPADGSGPVFKAMTVDGASARITFDHLGGGLVAKGAKLSGFAVAGDDGKFVWADARIDGDTVVVGSGTVPAPKAVRYGWADNPELALFSAAGLPAMPFRTDAPAK